MLERTGVGYPKTIRQAIDLFLYAGILLRIANDNALYLDAVIDPFPFPEDVLQLSSGEKVHIARMRQQSRRTQSPQQ